MTDERHATPVEMYALSSLALALATPPGEGK
jgi:hypothetical protein